MLCRINATINTTDLRAQAINFIRCIRAVCTAGAGTTPSVQPVTAPSTFGAGDCIVEVISNAEAGGWTESSTTTISSPFAGSQVTTAYSASYTGTYYVDLYNSATGKTTYPYYKQTIGTSFTAANFFGTASYLTYPTIDWSTGFHTATTLDGTYASGLIANGTGGVGHTCRNFTSNYAGASNATNYSNSGYAFKANAGEWLVASTSQYIIVIGSNGIFYWGNRSNAQWENSYTNNPYAFAFSYNSNSSTSATAVTTGTSSLNTVIAWNYTMDNTGTVSASPSWKQGNYNAANSVDPIGGSGTNTTGGAGYRIQGYETYNGFMAPLMPFGLRSNSGQPMVGPSTDSSTGANVPPAYPIVAAHMGSALNNALANPVAGIASNTGMVLPGIYRSLAGSDAFMNQFYTAGTTYVVGTENYYPYTVGLNTSFKDLFLIRKY
jgi:hypothetical protein